MVEFEEFLMHRTVRWTSALSGRIAPFAILITTLGLVACDRSAQTSAVAPLPQRPVPTDFCDGYVGVQWISVERSIGIAEYDRVDDTGQARHARALVLLGGDRPKMDYQANLKRLPLGQDGASEQVDAGSTLGEEVIRTWEIQTGLRGDSVGFSRGAQYFVGERINWDGPGSLEAGKRSVCMRYPDGRRTWIIELPSARTRYGAAMERHFAEAVRNIPASDRMRPTLEWFAAAGVIDVNHDGLDDYPSLGIYSYGGEYFPLRRRSDREQELDAFGTLTFEGNGASCEMDPPDATYLVADGTSVYLNRKCNLTQLSRKEK